MELVYNYTTASGQNIPFYDDTEVIYASKQSTDGLGVKLISGGQTYEMGLGDIGKIKQMLSSNVPGADRLKTILTNSYNSPSATQSTALAQARAESDVYIPTGNMSAEEAEKFDADAFAAAAAEQANNESTSSTTSDTTSSTSSSNNSSSSSSSSSTSTIPSYSEWKNEGITYGGGYTEWVKDYEAGDVSYNGQVYNASSEATDTTTGTTSTTGATTGTTSSDPIYSANSYTQAYNQFRLDTGGSYSDFKELYGTSAEWQAAKDGEVYQSPEEIKEEEIKKTETAKIETEQTKSGEANAIARADEALANGLIDLNTAEMFKTIARNWDVSEDINYDNLISEFNDFSENTISPFYAEQADIFKKDLLTAQSNLQQSRAEELEAQNINAEQNIENTQEDLASRGLTFSSEGAEQLGTESAFGGKVPFGGDVGEGLVQTENRLISSGSQSNYQQAIDSLGQQAENALGQNSLIEGYTNRGVTQGTIDQNEQQANASALSNLAGQESQNLDYQTPLTYNFS